MADELILIVEDDPNSRKLLRDVLGVKGYRTIEAVTGEEGLALLATQRPALILMDIQLPGISGIEALRRIRTDETLRALPVIAVTASVMSAQTRELFDAGFNDLEHKPVQMAVLLKKIRQHLDAAAKP